jgi:hypothetical protein
MGPIKNQVISNGQNAIVNRPSESAPNDMKENMLRKMHTVAKVIKASNEANVKKLH